MAGFYCGDHIHEQLWQAYIVVIIFMNNMWRAFWNTPWQAERTRHPLFVGGPLVVVRVIGPVSHRGCRALARCPIGTKGLMWLQFQRFVPGCSACAASVSLMAMMRLLGAFYFGRPIV